MARRASKWQLVRFARSTYVTIFPYQLINYARGATFDLAVLVPAATFGLWWASGSGGLRLNPTADWNGDGTSFLFTYHVAQYYPMLVALAYGAILVWHRRTRLKVSWYRPFSLVDLSDKMSPVFPRRIVATLGGIGLPTAIGYGLLCSIDLVFVPGSTTQRFVPLAAMTVWVWFMRNHVRGRVCLLTQTRAGFRPPARAALRPRYRAIMILLYGEALSKHRAGGYEAAARALRGDAELQAWCLAKGIDWALEHGRLAVAEELVDPQWPGMAGQTSEMPAYLAARAMFRRTVGSEQASQELGDAVAQCKGRVPYELAAMAEGDSVAHLEVRKPHAHPVLAGKIWTRRYALVLRTLLDRIRRARHSDRALAAAAARQIIELVDTLVQRRSLSSLGTGELARLDIVKAEAHIFLAELDEEMGRWSRAASEYYAAARLHRVHGDSHAAGIARARQATCVLRAGNNDSQTEGEALDDLRSGLQQIEDNRGSLRVSANRARIVTRYEEEIYAPILTLLTSSVAHHPDRAAELVLWLMESTRRNALADALTLNQSGQRSAEAAAAASALVNWPVGRPVRDSGHGVSRYEGTAQDRQQLDEHRKRLDNERRARLERAYQPKHVDLGRLYRRLGNRVALSYRCTSTEDGWLVTCVMVSPLGLRTHRWHIGGDGLSCPGSEPGWYKKPASILGRIDMDLNPDATATEDSSTLGAGIAFLHNLRFRYELWDGLAAQLLPPELGETLRRTGVSQGGRPVLVIVPDGPLCAIPFAGLRLADGRTLAEHAVTVFVPNFDMVLEPEAPHRPYRPTVVANLAETKLVLEGMDIDLRVRFNTADFQQELRRLPAPDVAVISNHGLLAPEPYQQVLMLADGASVSAAEAAEWLWPATVVLGTCWAARMAITPGDDSVGFPVACLLGGATTVVGSQAPLYNISESQALVAIAARADASGHHVAIKLSEAMREFAATRRGDLPPPAAWAALTVWSTRLPEAPALSKQTLRPRWAPQGTVLHEATNHRTASQPTRVPLAVSLERALLHAMTNTSHIAVDTLDAFAAITHVTDLNWTSYLVAIGVGPPQGAERTSELDQASTQLPTPETESGLLTVSATLARAVRLGERLAIALGDPVIAPAHVVYGIVNDPTCMAVAWMRGHQGNGASIDLVEPLSELIFGIDLPPDTALPTLPEAEEGASANLSEAQRQQTSQPVPTISRASLQPRRAIRRGIVRHGARRYASMCLTGLIIGGLLGVYVVTYDLHDVGNAPSTAAQLAGVSAQLSGVIRPTGSPALPALFLGALSEYYTRPGVTGAVDEVMEAARKSVPASLDGWDFFLTPGNATTGRLGPIPAKLTIHAETYSAKIYCASQMVDSLCFAVAQLPSDAVPSGSLWHAFNSPNLAPGTYTMPVDVLTRPGPSGAVATASLLTDVQEDEETFTARRVGAGGIPLLSPVVLQGGDYGLPIFGVVDKPMATIADGDSYPVIPMANIIPYLDQLAEWQGGGLPGSTGLLGVAVEDDPTSAGALVTGVLRGSPADFAGLAPRDVVLKIGGVPTTGPDQMMAQVGALTPGARVPVVVARSGKQLTLDVTIGYRPL